MIRMCMAVKLAPDYVCISVYDCCEPHRPVIQIALRGDMSNYVNHLTDFL